MDLIRHPAYETKQRPFMVIWETTQACDLACRHCRAEAQPKLDPLALGTNDAKRLLDQVKNFGKLFPIFIFTGGDPFKREDLFELVQYGSEIGLPMGVSPSGTPLLTTKNLLRLKQCNAKAISLSIDGSSDEKHDEFRGVPGSFQWTLHGWQEARKIGLKVQINTTVTRFNLLDLDLRDTKLYGGRCGVCEFAEICGGSRSRAYAMTGDAFAEEPFCNDQPDTFPFQSELKQYLKTTRL